MPAKKYRIKLTTEEQQELKALVSKGRAAAYKQTHARILLLSDEARKDGSMTDEEVARSLEIASATVERVRRRCVEEGIEAALGRKEQQRRRPKKLDGAAEAHLIALACGEPPEGRARWTLRLLADRLVGVRDSGEHPPRDGAQDTEKNELKPWLKECWCIPPKGSSDFVCAMEDVLEVYHRPYEDNEVLGRSWEVLGSPGKSWKSWKSWEVLGSPWKSWEVLGSLGSPGKSWEVLEVLGSPGKSWEVLGSPWKSWGSPGRNQQTAGEGNAAAASASPRIGSRV